MGTELKPCPFCGSGDHEIRENGRTWTGMKWGEPASVSVLHWCEATPGQPSRLLERVGRDHESAIAAWNRRTPAEAAHVAPVVQAQPVYIRTDHLQKVHRGPFLCAVQLEPQAGYTRMVEAPGSNGTESGAGTVGTAGVPATHNTQPKDQP